MENLHIDIRKFDWLALCSDGLDDDNRKELDALVVRVNEHQTSIAVAGHPFPNYVVMLSFMLEEHKDLMRLQKEISGLGIVNFTQLFLIFPFTKTKDFQSSKNPNRKLFLARERLRSGLYGFNVILPKDKEMP